jgi:pyridoxal phosphate-dependent aminotransferase EpsN
VNGKQVGLSGIGVISFNNNKINTTFGGGVLLLNDEAMASKARFWAAQARENLPYYEHRELGYNYRMGSLNAAYGLAQWPELGAAIAARQSIFERYVEGFDGAGDFPFYSGTKSITSNRWLSTFGFTKEQKTKIEQTLNANSIETRPLWNPLHRQPLFAGTLAFERGVAADLFDRGICLPSSTNLSVEDQNEVIELVKAVLTNA